MFHRLHSEILESNIASRACQDEAYTGSDLVLVLYLRHSGLSIQPNSDSGYKQQESYRYPFTKWTTGELN